MVAKPAGDLLVGRKIGTKEITIGSRDFTLICEPGEALNLAARVYTMAEEIMLEDGVTEQAVKAEFDEARKEFEG